jgi:hypothetical protein
VRVVCTSLRRWSPTVWDYTLSMNGRTLAGQIVSKSKPTSADVLEHLRASMIGLKNLLGGEFDNFLKGEKIE